MSSTCECMFFHRYIISSCRKSSTCGWTPTRIFIAFSRTLQRIHMCISVDPAYEKIGPYGSDEQQSPRLLGLIDDRLIIEKKRGRKENFVIFRQYWWNAWV